jgi:hypothetical protein
MTIDVGVHLTLTGFKFLSGGSAKEMQDAPMSPVIEIAPDVKPTRGMMLRYLLAFVSAVVLAVPVFLIAFAFIASDGGVSHDYFSEIAKGGDANWYRDFGGRHIPQIQDEDIFYSNVGHSVASAKAADIVLLGPSFVSYALDRDTLQSSPLLGQLKIYNMAFVGIRGGEFSRRVINRWSIRAPLWVINVDDQFVHFFSDDLDLTIGPEKTPIAAVRRNPMRGYLTVVGRNIRWRTEDLVAAMEQGQYSLSGLFGLYRNVSNGDMLLSANPGYVANDNQPMRLSRDPDCHTNPTVVDYARNFLNEVGGNVVFMLVPHSQSCVRQAAELANALNVELIAPPFDGLTTVDGGGHLDRHGAEKFTSYLAAELVKTAAFKRAFVGRLGYPR